MLFEDLATELIANVFLSCTSLHDVVNLAVTCHRIHNIYSARKLTVLTQASEAQYGPLQDAIQLVTHNDSQPAHVIRSVPVSIALLKQVASVGRVAKRWEDIYPFKKWKDKFEDRRLLRADEARVFRRALYRVWLYARAFHNAAHHRYARLSRPAVLERAQLLHNWSNAELAEIADVRQVLRDLLRCNICPSNGTIQRKFRRRFPDSSYQLQFNMHLNYPPPPLSSAAGTVFSSQQQQYHHHHQHGRAAAATATAAPDKYHAKYRPTPLYEPGGEGWGDDIAHYYVVEDMMKLDPAQVLWLRENCSSKREVEGYVKGLGEWFENNGETFGQTLEFVLGARGECVDVFVDEVAEGERGVVICAT